MKYLSHHDHHGSPPTSNDLSDPFVGNASIMLLSVNEESLRRILRSYFDYYHKGRTHLSWGKDAPEPRAIRNPELGKVITLPIPILV